MTNPVLHPKISLLIISSEDVRPWMNEAGSKHKPTLFIMSFPTALHVETRYILLRNVVDVDIGAMTSGD